MPRLEPTSIVGITIERGTLRKGDMTYARPFTIGRDDSCDVQFDHPRVSGRHAEIGWDGAQWYVQDLNSSNGTFVNGEKISRTAVASPMRIEFARKGVIVTFELEPIREPKRRAVKPPSHSQIAKHYFADVNSGNVGQRTRMIREAFRTVRRKQTKHYRIVIGVIALLLVGTAGALYFQSRRVARMEQMRGIAERAFYAMKSLELQSVRLHTMAGKNADPALLAEMEDKKRLQRDMKTQYETFSRDELGISQDRLSREDWLIYKVARVFGECDVSMPSSFAQTVREYIRRWQSTPRFRRALQRATANNYAPRIARAMLAHDMPSEFFYLAMQESDFDPDRCGPETRYGIAKGMWQFIPRTAMRYGLRTGPLIGHRRADPRDERHDFEKSTVAAAQYLRDIYETEAQASGLLVIACYNWGEDNVRELINQLPEDPRERNFWKLLARKKIPEETYDYVFYIVSAAVIGENPRLFGFEMDPPLRDLPGDSPQKN